MLKRVQLFPIQFYKKEAFTGSMGKWCFRLGKIQEEDENGQQIFLEAVIWPGPLCYTVAEKTSMVRKRFEFSEDGITDTMNWLNEFERSAHAD